MTAFRDYQKQAKEMQLMGLNMAEQMMGGKKVGGKWRNPLYEVLDFTPPFGSDAFLRSAEAVLPLIAGSFLSTCFIFLSLVILFIKGRTLAKQQLITGTRLSGIHPDEST